jgi:hypothetical protein
VPSRPSAEPAVDERERDRQRGQVGAGWDGAQASAIMAAIDYLVLGSALETFAAGFDRPPEEYAEDYPSLSRALSEADRASLDDRGFELGLETLIAGLGAPR